MATLHMMQESEFSLHKVQYWQILLRDLYVSFSNMNSKMSFLDEILKAFKRVAMFMPLASLLLQNGFLIPKIWSLSSLIVRLLDIKTINGDFKSR